MVHFLISLVFFISQSFAAVVPSGVPVVGFGQSINATAPTAPTIFNADITKFYSATCNFGTSTVTAGNYYKCYKMGYTGSGSNPGTDWQIASGKTAYCPGFYFSSNAASVTTNMAFNFGFGTAAVTNNSASAPTGNVTYAPTGMNFYLTSMTSGTTINGANSWVSVPVSFSAVQAGAAIYPYMQASNGGSVIYVTLICTDQ